VTRKAHRVVDTNVALVASGLCDTATPECVFSCIAMVRQILDDRTVLVLDDGDRILAEYAKQLSATGEPGVGGKLLKWVYINQYNPSRCQRVAVYSADDEGLAYAELDDLAGLEGFDPDDRKFLAAALGAPQETPIVNAVDSDWLEYRAVLEAAGVVVEFVCGEAACTRGH